MTLNFSQLLNDDHERVACLSNDEELSWLRIRKEVFILRARLMEADSTHWILACDSCHAFLIGLLALISANKEILLPANNLSGTLNETLQGGQAVLTDLDIETTLPEIRLYELLAEFELAEQPDYPSLNIDVDKQFIQICTSGSSGEPRQIRKSLRTLESEIHGLQALWGEAVKAKYVVSTVSHQHIYGLLFRVLWPLMTHRIFVEENIEYPEQIHSIAKRWGELVLVSSPAYLKRMADVLDKDIMRRWVKVIYSSGGPLANDTAMGYSHSFATTPIEVLGSTESGGIAYRQQQEVEVFWQKFAEVQITRQNGALAIKSPYCYCDGWFEMGDAVELISDSTFRLLARLDRIVKVEEKRLSLDQMESRLSQNKLIQAAKITVLPGHRTILGAVCVLSDAGSRLLEQIQRRAFSKRLRDYLGDYFDRVCLPRKWRYVPDFPYNSQGKLTQADLAKLFDEAQND